MSKCKISDNNTDLVFEVAEKWLLDLIKKENPEWVREDGSCPECEKYYEELGNAVKVI